MTQAVYNVLADRINALAKNSAASASGSAGPSTDAMKTQIDALLQVPSWLQNTMQVAASTGAAAMGGGNPPPPPPFAASGDAPSAGSGSASAAISSFLNSLNQPTTQPQPSAGAGSGGASASAGDAAQDRPTITVAGQTITLPPIPAPQAAKPSP